MRSGGSRRWQLLFIPERQVVGAARAAADAWWSFLDDRDLAEPQA